MSGHLGRVASVQLLQVVRYSLACDEAAALANRLLTIHGAVAIVTAHLCACFFLSTVRTRINLEVAAQVLEIFSLNIGSACLNDPLLWHGLRLFLLYDHVVLIF